ncbi:hypothetical protein CPJCM30710_22770 [Clostridium polyendosporum]|uniref:DUF2278 domain-containing protein n=1 Tax=Clostridium polyendosporum TaxID=69208 RepID=A0A919VHE9_9CLOT|nr:YukJ family protein [Clostridium polyendosporum]GIM29611.1 hypothetical protein CPJCM30710_22770 [Clostridium polyendosporum]
MPVHEYGVLKGIVKGAEMDPITDSSPHYKIIVEGEKNKKYEVVVNVMSSKDSKRPELLYLADKNFNPQAITKIEKLKDGFHHINDQNREIAIDYIRGNLFNPSKMTILEHYRSGPDNDLYEFLNDFTMKAKKQMAKIYVYGAKFYRGLGVHNVHMNQGNDKIKSEDNGIWQDGCLLYEFNDHWVAIFLAFQNQFWCTQEHGNKKGYPCYDHGFCSHKDKPRSC